MQRVRGTTSPLGFAKMKMRRQTGFSLIELLIVVAIILIIAAIAIPSLLRSKIAANESSAVSSVRQIKVAEVAYYTNFPTVGYANAMTNLGGLDPCTPTPAAGCVLDDFLAHAGPGSAGKSGYIFGATGISSGGGGINADFVVAAAPVSARQTGDRNFCATSDGALRSQPGSTGSVPVTTTAACVAFPSIVQ
jgi:type IV pilus assembly protein PilA